MRLPAAVVLPLLLTGTSPASDAAAEMAAPFTVVRARGAYVRVDIGEKRTRSGLLRLATVVTPEGAMPAVLDRVERVCTVLCGEKDGETCHFEAIVRMERPVRGAIAVLPGRPLVSDVEVLAAGPDAPADADPGWVDAPGFGEGGDTYRWVRYPDGVYFVSTGSGRDSGSTALSSCTQRQMGPFVRLACNGAELLYDHRRPIVASFGDYSVPTATPQHRLRLDGVEAFLIRYGLKAEVVVALIVKAGGTWRVYHEGADYPLLC